MQRDPHRAPCSAGRARSPFAIFLTLLAALSAVLTSCSTYRERPSEPEQVGTTRQAVGSGSTGWYPGFVAGGADCWVDSGSVLCGSAEDACHSIASLYAGTSDPPLEQVVMVLPPTLAPTGIYRSGLECLYLYLGTLNGELLYTNNDLDSPTGYTPPGGQQTVKQVGGGGTACEGGCNSDSTQDSNGVTSTGSNSEPSGVGNNFAGEPINIATGNMAYRHTDYTTAGQNPLSFTRYYNSRGTYSGTMGPNWRSSYDRAIWIFPSTSPPQVGVQRADGQVLYFTKPSSTWVTDTDVDYTLTQSGSTWTLTTPDDTVEVYTNITAGYLSGLGARLGTITARNGYAKTLSYNSNGLLATVTDSYSRTLTLSYTSKNRLATVVTPDYTTITYGYTTSVPPTLATVTWPTSPSQTLTYVYGNSYLPSTLTGVTDENSNTFLTWTYDNYGRALTSKVGTGTTANTTTVTYNDTTGARTVTNALGVTDTFSYSTSLDERKLTGISRASTATTAAASEAFTYDSNGFLATRTDWNGNSTHYTNNGHGQATTIVEAYGAGVARTTTIAYNSTFPHLPATITTPGVTATFTYDSSGNQLTKTLTDTTSTSTPYSTNGQTRTWTNTWSSHLLASVQSPRTDVTAVTSFSYDGVGTLRTITDALGHVTDVTMAQIGGLPQRVLDPNGVTTAYSWDARQRLEYVIADYGGGGYTTYYDHNGTGETTQLYPPDGTLRQYNYDTAHRLTKVNNGYNQYIQYTLDALGNATRAQTFDSTPTMLRDHVATFDALGRKLTDVGGASQTTTFTYDSNGNALTVKDGLNNTTTNTYDALDRLSTSTDASSGVVTTTYDAHDRPLTVQDANGNTTSYVYDGFGDVIQETSPDRGTSVYHYDNNGNLTQKVDAASVTVNQTFDKLDRVLTTAYPADTTLNVGYTYDQTGTGFSNGIGRLTSVSDKAGTLTRAYDPRGNLLTEKRVNSGTTYTTSYTYNGFDRLLSTTYPDGTLVSNQYDWPGNVYGMTATPTGGSSITLASLVDHFPFGPLKYIGYGNGNTETWFADLDYRPTSIHGNHGPITSTQVMRLDYAYDASNNVSTVTDYQTGANTQTLGYDVLNRLTSAVSGSGGYGTQGWTYDHNGNTTAKTIFGQTYSYTLTSGTNRIASATYTGSHSEAFTYTATGNISARATDGTTNVTVSYNAANRAASFGNGTSTLFTAVYGFDGHRITKTASGVTTFYTYGQNGELLAEKNLSTGATTDYAYVDGLPIAVFEPGVSPTANQINYVFTDRLGTPQLVDNNSQTAVWSATYDPYGTRLSGTSSVTQNQSLPGQYRDVESGFNYNWNRDYSTTFGRYLEADPIGLEGGLNPYAYANGNPLVNVDPEGLASRSVPIRCSHCGAPTGTTFAPYCPDCYSKSLKPGSDVPPVSGCDR